MSLRLKKSYQGPKMALMHIHTMLLVRNAIWSSSLSVKCDRNDGMSKEVFAKEHKAHSPPSFVSPFIFNTTAPIPNIRTTSWRAQPELSSIYFPGFFLHPHKPPQKTSTTFYFAKAFSWEVCWGWGEIYEFESMLLLLLLLVLLFSSCTDDAVKERWEFENGKCLRIK